MEISKRLVSELVVESSSDELNSYSSNGRFRVVATSEYDALDGIFKVMNGINLANGFLGDSKSTLSRSNSISSSE
eukprot:scaffold60914_cov51-Attheya_sp.AAC.1